MPRGPLAQKFWDEFTQEEQQEIMEAAQERIQEYRNLEELRKSVGLTSEKISQILAMSQGNLSQLEQNSDMLLSTLQNHIQALGGKLNLTLELPDQPPIPLSGLGDLIERPNPD